MRAIILCTLLAACGSAHKGDDASPTPQQQPADKATGPAQSPVPHSLAVADAGALPACDAAHDLQLVYVMADKKFQTCQAGAWQAIELPVPAAPVAKQPVADVVAALGAIELLKPIAQLDPRSQALLGAKYVTVKDLTADTDTCVSPHTAKAGSDYSAGNYPGYTDGTSGVLFSVEVRAGVVTQVFYKVDEKPAVVEKADCTKF